MVKYNIVLATNVFQFYFSGDTPYVNMAQSSIVSDYKRLQTAQPGVCFRRNVSPFMTLCSLTYIVMQLSTAMCRQNSNC